MGTKYRNLLSSFRWKRYVRIPVSTTAELSKLHFETYSHENHVNRIGIEKCLNLLAGRPVSIIETGTSAWGTDSTRLWAKYISHYGGYLWTVDIREEPSKTLGNLGPNVTFIINDSVVALEELASNKSLGKADLIYLDSWDVDWSAPLLSAEHGLREWQKLQPFIQSGTLVLIDDTPKSKTDLELVGIQNFDGTEAFIKEYKVMPGKGAFILTLPEINDSWEVIHHTYNVLLRKK